MALEAKTLSDLSPASRKAFDRATTALAQKNYGYAFDILRNLLRTSPGFLEGRKLLRQAQIEHVGNEVKLVRQIVATLKTAIPIFIKGPLLVKKGRLGEALDLAEHAMDADPTLLTTLTFLADTAETAGLHETAIHTMEVAAVFHGKSLRVMQELGRLYANAEDYEKALKIWQTLHDRLPDNIEVDSEIRRLSALSSMKTGKWEQDGDYRGKMKNKQEAETLEQQTRVTGRDADSLDDLIKAAEATLAAEPSFANHKQLAELYHQAKMFDKALQEYGSIVDASGRLDAAIDDLMMQIHVERFDSAVAQWQAYAVQHPDKKEETDRSIAEIGQQKSDMLLKRLHDRIQRYPNDATYRYELGELLYARHENDAALQEFQQAQRNPQFRRIALGYMGRCMMRKNLPDLAIEQFNAALDGLDKTDPERKEILYDLALALESQGTTADAVAKLREIYAIDVNFRDVGARLQKYYQQRTPEA